MTDLEQRLIDAAIAFGNAAKMSRDAYDARVTDGSEARRIAIAFYESQKELHTAAKLVAAEKRK